MARNSRPVSPLLEPLSGERERIAALLSGMHEQLLLVTADGRIALVNEAFCRLFHLDPDALAGRPYSDVIPEAEVVQFIEQALRTRGAERGEIKIQMGALGRRHFTLSASPLLSPTGQFQGVVLIFHDVTLARKMEKMRRQFVDNVSHELKTPLSAIYAVIETLMEVEPPEPEQRRRFYQFIHENTLRLSNLINDLLDLSEIEQRKASLEWAEYPLADLVRDLAADFLPAAQRKTHELVVEAPETLPTIETDKKAFSKALGNIIDNAIKYTEEGGRIVVSAAADGPAYVRVQVADNGIGIPPKYQERIFERFYRVDKARSIKSGGTGLGLSIVKHITEALGGRVLLESAPGKGTTFTLRLPRRRPSTPPAEGD